MVGALLIGLVYCFLVGSSGAGGYNRYFVSLERLRNDPERVDRWHQYLNTEVGQGKILMVGEAEVFDLKPPVLYNTCFDDCIFEKLVTDPATGRLLPAAAVPRRLADNGITQVHVDWPEIRRYRQPGNYGFAEFVQPEVFAELVKQGVLKEIRPPWEVHPDDARTYRVVGATADVALVSPR